MEDRKDTQIVTRITLSDRDWLDTESRKLGLNASSFVRMKIREARNASAAVAPRRVELA